MSFRSMAIKETAHRESVEEMTRKIAELQRINKSLDDPREEVRGM